MSGFDSLTAACLLNYYRCTMNEDTEFFLEEGTYRAYIAGIGDVKPMLSRTLPTVTVKLLMHQRIHKVMLTGSMQLIEMIVASKPYWISKQVNVKVDHVRIPEGRTYMKYTILFNTKVPEDAGAEETD
jgi:hypothetical protein